MFAAWEMEIKDEELVHSGRWRSHTYRYFISTSSSSTPPSDSYMRVRRGVISACRIDWRISTTAEEYASCGGGKVSACSSWMFCLHCPPAGRSDGLLSHPGLDVGEFEQNLEDRRPPAPLIPSMMFIVSGPNAGIPPRPHTHLPLFLPIPPLTPPHPPKQRKDIHTFPTTSPYTALASASLNAPSESPPLRIPRTLPTRDCSSAPLTGCTPGVREARSKLAEESASRASMLMVRKLRDVKAAVEDVMLVVVEGVDGVSGGGGRLGRSPR